MKNYFQPGVTAFAAICLLVCGCQKSEPPLSGRIRALESEVSSLRTRLDEVHAQLTTVSGRLSNVGENFRAVQNEVGELRLPIKDLPYGITAVGQTGKVFSPYATDQGLVDVAGMNRGTRIKCPYTGKHFRVP